jgi:hypothetical protein
VHAGAGDLAGDGVLLEVDDDHWWCETYSLLALSSTDR